MSLHEHLRNTREAPWWRMFLVELFGKRCPGDGGYVYDQFRGKGYFSHRL